MLSILKNKITTSIIFIIISNLIFNYNFLINLNYLETDFSLLVRKWFLGQYLFSYDVEFVKRGFISSVFYYLNINITYGNQVDAIIGNSKELSKDLSEYINLKVLVNFGKKF